LSATWLTADSQFSQDASSLLHLFCPIACPVELSKPLAQSSYFQSSYFQSITAIESTLKHTHKYIMPSYNYTGTKPKKTAYFADGSTKVYSQNKGNGNMHAAGQKAIKEKGSGKSLKSIPKKDRTKVE
jgi:hypothetical protein